MKKYGIKPRAKNERQKDSDPLKRFREIPLHAVLLYAPEDCAIDFYIKQHWASLHSLSSDYCDIHPFLSQLEGNEDAYDFVDKLDVVRDSGFDRLSELPGIFFWTLQGDYIYVPLGFLEGSELSRTFRTIFEEIRRAPTIDAVRKARSRLQKEENVIDLLAASQVASIAGNAVNIIDKIYAQFIGFSRKGAEVHPPSAVIENSPSSNSLVTKANGNVVQKITYSELATKLDGSDLTYIKAREASLRNYQVQWETIYPNIAISAVDEQARLRLRLDKIAQEMSLDLSAILSFCEKRLGVSLDDHYLAVREIAQQYSQK